jgi:hypothetical protein
VERTTIAGETEVLGENLPSATLSHHKSHMPSSGFETRTAAVGSQRLTAWAMARPYDSALLNPLSVVHKGDKINVSTSNWFLAWPIIWIGRGKRYVLPKRRLTFNWLHGLYTFTSCLSATLFTLTPLHKKIELKIMASWKPKHVVNHCLKLQTYFINCCVVTVFNKEICKNYPLKIATYFGYTRQSSGNCPTCQNC